MLGVLLDAIKILVNSYEKRRKCATNLFVNHVLAA